MRITNFQRKVKIAKWVLRQGYGVFSNMTATNALKTANKLIKQNHQFNIANRKKIHIKFNSNQLPF